MKQVETQIVCGMPHLLSNSDLNLNHISKILGDVHWHYMYDRPIDAKVNGNRVYQSFLKLQFNINQTFEEDVVLNVKTTGEYIDDAIFKTEHVFGENKIDLYSIGIIIDNGSIVKASKATKRNKEFWSDHREIKRSAATWRHGCFGEPISFQTYPTIDFNCAGILYCANYVRFVYQYADQIRKKANIKGMYFFGNIQPYDNVELMYDKHVHIKSNGKLIATCICDLEDI